MTHTTKNKSFVARVTEVCGTAVSWNWEPLGIGERVTLIREWNHQDHPYLVSVWVERRMGRMCMGYVGPESEEVIVRALERGERLVAEVHHFYQADITLLPDILLRVSVAPSE